VALFFWLAGRLNWTRGWAYIGLITIGQSISGLYVWRRDPEVLRRRGKIGQGTKTWDKIVLGLFGTTYFALIVVAALDERYDWSSMSGWFWPLGVAMYAFCVFMLTWATAVNTHFEKTVRIQHDRGHRVIDSGPYRIVRHPGYLGAIFGFILAAPLLLGSWWAFAPAVIAVACLAVRTALEDRTLRKELDGYEAYVQTVRYRLLPGLW
ncbi:MAG: methyltransferase family protein, partial [Planctomycetota bacterium]